jgi:hypothetical protein
MKIVVVFINLQELKSVLNDRRIANTKHKTMKIDKVARMVNHDPGALKRLTRKANNT